MKDRKQENWFQAIYAHRIGWSRFFLHHFNDEIEVSFSKHKQLGIRSGWQWNESTLFLDLGFLFFSIMISINLSRVNKWLPMYGRLFGLMISGSRIEVSFMEGDNTMNEYMHRKNNTRLWRFVCWLYSNDKSGGKRGRLLNGFSWSYWWENLLGEYTNDSKLMHVRQDQVNFPSWHGRPAATSLFALEITHHVVGRRFAVKQDLTRVSIKLIGGTAPTWGGKGENSWDQDDNELADMSFCASETEHIIPTEKQVATYLNESVLQQRKKYG